MEDVKKLANELQEKLEAIEKMVTDNGADALSAKNTVNQLKTDLENVVKKDDLADIEKSIEELSKAFEQTKVSKINRKSTVKGILRTALLKGLKDKNLLNEKGEINIVKNPSGGFEIDVNKADIAHNIAVTAAGGTFPSDDANVDSNILLETAIETQMASTLRRLPTFITQLTGATPLRVGDALKWLVKVDGTGTPLTVAELKQKPNATFELSKETVESKKVAVKVIISEEFANRVDYVLNELVNGFYELVGEVLEEEIFGDTNGIGQFAVPYAHDVALTFPDANKYDAINATLASMYEAKYRPSHFVINHLDFAQMFGEKGTDGHYSLANGMSVQLIDGGNTLVVGGYSVSLVKVTSDILTAGTFRVIDLSKLRYGLSPSTILRYDPYTYIESNAVQYILEAVYAVGQPSTYPYSVVEDTFENVIDQINEPVV